MKLTHLDAAVLDCWHVVSAVDDIRPGVPKKAVLLDTELKLCLDIDGAVQVRVSRDGRLLPSVLRYGYLWTSLGQPPDDLFAIPEYDEAGRKNIHVITVGINVSAPRAIENFLDMAHFPFVHTDILGAEPHTEIKEYEVEINDRDEVIATGCRIYQPLAAAASTEGADVDYIYRIPHPYCSVLYKTSPEDPSRFDVIALFVQPESEETIRASMMCSLVDNSSTLTDVRSFQQTILGQDKPILENQFPKRLPLDPRAETPIRADKSAITYRRWLGRKGVTYGVIPAAT